MDGGSAITSYVLYWNQSGSMVPVHGDPTESLDTSFTITSLVTSGGTYEFYWKAKNIHGLSDPSPIETILASGVPDQPDPPTTEVLSTGVVKISWTNPANTGGTGVPITGA